MSEVRGTLTGATIGALGWGTLISSVFLGTFVHFTPNYTELMWKDSYDGFLEVASHNKSISKKYYTAFVSNSHCIMDNKSVLQCCTEEMLLTNVAPKDLQSFEPVPQQMSLSASLVMTSLSMALLFYPFIIFVSIFLLFIHLCH